MNKVDEMLTAPIDSFSEEERRRLLCALLDRSTKHLPLVEPPDHGMLIFAADNIGPGVKYSMAARCYEGPFLATRLVFLDVEREQTDQTEIVTKTTRGALWWKKTIAEKRSIYSRRMVSSPAGAWDLHAIFAGAWNLFPAAQGPLPMSAFTLDLSPVHAIVRPAIDVAISVSHRLEGPASFRALLLGKKVETE